jgi:hypothetical protein
MVTFARHRELSANAMVAQGNQGEIRRVLQMVHKAYVQKSTVFAVVTRGEWKKPVFSAVRRGVCNV